MTPCRGDCKPIWAIILSGTQTAAARGQRLSQLQTLLPSIDFTAKETAAQVDLPAQGLRLPGIPTVVGPFGYTDIRASLTWSLLDLPALRNYLAARNNFASAQLSAQDARDMVVLTVGNAYLLVLADQTRITSVEAQVATSKVSLDQAIANHQAGNFAAARRIARTRRLSVAGAGVDRRPATHSKKTSWPWRAPSACLWRSSLP